MKMSDVRVGMRLRSTIGQPEFVTVTALTERGFEYCLDAARPFIPRWGMSFAKDGHEHFGHDGEAYYEPVAPATPTNQASTPLDTTQASAVATGISPPTNTNDGEGQ